MGKSFFDCDSGEFIFSMSEDNLISSDGHLMSRISDTSAIDLVTGELHWISSFDADNDSFASNNLSDED